MIHRRFHNLSLLALALVLVATLPWSSKGNIVLAEPVSKEPIKIGLISSLSGVASEPGQDLVNGMQLYLDQIGHKMAGRRVDLLVENDETSAATGLAKWKKLTSQNKVQVVTGLIFAHIGIAVAAQAEKDHIPLVLAVTAADDLTQRDRGNWVIRSGFSSSQPMYPFGEWVYKTLGYRKVVTLGHDFPYAWEQVGGFQKTFEQAGGKIVQKLWVPLGFVDYSSFLKQIHPDADAVLLCTTSAGAIVIPKQYKEMGLKMPIISGSSSYDEAVLRHLGDEAKGVVSSSFYSCALSNPNNVRFVSAYRKRFGNNPSLFSECGYTSGILIGKAVEAVGGNVESASRFMAALRKVELKDAPRGPIKLDEFGNPIENIYVMRVDRVKGNLQNTVIATFNNVSQFWKWSPKEYMNQAPFSRTNPPCLNCKP
jgi:branched-chain amino acid transport system substrate-binding protein